MVALAYMLRHIFFLLLQRKIIIIWAVEDLKLEVHGRASKY